MQFPCGGYTCRSSQNRSAAAKYGKPVKVSGSPGMDEIATTRVNARTYDASAKQGGKVVFTDHRTVSSDGKTMTIARKGTNPEGKPFTATIVFDKQ